MRLLLPALFLLALGVRLVPWHSVYRPTGVLPFGNDAFYHLRRIRFSVANFPASLDVDPFINFPHGGQPIWPPTLDWLIAAGFRLSGIQDPDRIEQVAPWIPPILGAATVLLLYDVARRLHSRAVALLAASILSVLPAHFYYSQLGFLDHHVVVAFLSTLLLAAGTALFREPLPAGGSDGRGLLRGAALGLALAALVLVWPGALLHAGIVGSALAARLLLERDRKAAQGLARRFAVAGFVAAAAVAPLCVGNEWTRWGRFSAVVLTSFQPVAFLLMGLAFAAPAALWRHGLGDTRAGRALGAAVVGAALGGALLAVPAAREALGVAWAWLSKGERFQAAVNESLPLFGDFRPAHRARALGFLTGFVYGVPVAVALLWREARGRADRQLFLWWAGVLFAATVVQWRFMDSYSVAHALLLAWTAAHLRGALAARLRRPRAASALVALALALLLLPSLRGYRSHLRAVWSGLRGGTPETTAKLRERELIVETARWLREHGAPLEEPGYSVLGPWGDGHVLKYVAERPVVQDNFGDDVTVENFEKADLYFAAESEAEALDLLAELGTRYVLVRATGSGHAAAPYAPNTLFRRLHGSLGSAAAPDAPKAEARAGDAPSAALERHRIVYASPPGPGRSRPYCTLWEIVEGARVTGAAEPGAPVELSLRVALGGGRAFRFVARTRADAAGRYALRVPYANEPWSPDVRPGARTRLRSGEHQASLLIPGLAVRTGAEVEGPSLRATPPGG